MRNLSVIVAAGTQCAVPANGCRSHCAGPGDDDDDDETPIGDPPDDDGDDDWDDDDDDDDDDEEPLQAILILRRSIAFCAPSRHNGGPIDPLTVAALDGAKNSCVRSASLSTWARLNSDC